MSTGEVIRRIDGRHIRQFLQVELAQPLGLDICLGVPDEALARRLAIERIDRIVFGNDTRAPAYVERLAVHVVIDSW
jgi:hypothetical protein